MKFRFPAEWNSSGGTWLAWPHRADDWFNDINPIHETFEKIILSLSTCSALNVVCQSVESRDELKERLSTRLNSNILFYVHPTNRSWFRDSLPTGVLDENGNLNWIGWDFSGWARYEDFKLDREMPKFVAEVSKKSLVLPMHNGRHVVLEGGAIDTDGEGTLLVTKECLVSNEQVRNPGFTEADYEEIFSKYLGIEKTIWIEKGIVGDDTHGHIDDVARFLAPGIVALGVESDSADDNYLPLLENLKLLKGERDSQGRKLEVVEIPMPRPVTHQGERFPASYLNFYVNSKALLVPTFGDEADETAVSILSKHFPDREVFPINCRSLILGQGTIHCSTQQVPVG